MTSLIARLKILLVGGLLFILIHGINIGMDGMLTQYGIVPRNQDYLPFIYTSPWIHGNLTHLLNNLVGWGIFSGLCLLRSIRFYVLSSFAIITITGLLVWLFARPAMHIGASGWIFGLWSLVIAQAWFDRRLKNILLAVLVAFFYGGMIYGVLPQGGSISYESHLFGALSGIVVAWLAKILKGNK